MEEKTQLICVCCVHINDHGKQALSDHVCEEMKEMKDWTQIPTRIYKQHAQQGV